MRLWGPCMAALPLRSPHRFTSTLVTNDPLQTLFQLMSGRIPQAALVCEQEAVPGVCTPVLSPACDTCLVVTISAHLRSPPVSLQCCGDATWGDWRPHLAVMLSNKVGDMELNHRAIITMGDTLGELRPLRTAMFRCLVTAGWTLQCHHVCPRWHGCMSVLKWGTHTCIPGAVRLGRIH